MSRVSARERTISLFTGQTEAGGGELSRDGTRGDLPRVQRGSFSWKWDEERLDGRTIWLCRDRSAMIERHGLVYTASIGGRPVGTFDNIHDATNCIERRDVRRRTS